MRAWASCMVAVAMVGQGACGARGGYVSAPVAGDAASWRYEVVADEQAHSLWVEAWLPRGSLTDLVVRPGGERFLDDVQVKGDDGWYKLPRRGLVVHASECARGCRLRYRFALYDAARVLHDTDLAIAWGEVVEASPSLWLLHPALAPAGARYRFHMHMPQGVSFVTGTFLAEDQKPDTYEADASNVGVAPYAAFGPVRIHPVEAVNGATLEVAIAPGAFRVTDDALVAWAAKSARTIARFFGCFPLRRVLVLVVPARGDQVRHGETMGDGGASIVVEVGERASEAALADDWVLPHEMVHLAVPNVSRRHHWLEEGIAVYVQPIARARTGDLTPEQVWREFAQGMPKGVPAHAQGGLDGTKDWARTYWGGATFCLLADLEIRERTGNRMGLEDALRGVLASGGSIARIWGLDRLLETADASVGGSVFRSMHEEMGRMAGTVDLPRLFRDLGVIVRGDEVTLIDKAPLAALREAITEPLPADVPAPVACPYGWPGQIAQR